MNEQFKIRKNKSQKEFYEPKQLPFRSPILANQCTSKYKVYTVHSSTKQTHLEPLYKSKNSLEHFNNKSSDAKLEHTQPVPHKSSSLNKHDIRYQGFHLEPLDIHLPLKPQQTQKQNRATSINQTKCPTINKIQSTFLKTDKSQNNKDDKQTYEHLPHTKSDKQNPFQQCKKPTKHRKQSKMHLLKTSSRTKLAKIYPKVQHNDFYQTQNDSQSQLATQRTFRKGIINKIFNPLKNKTNDLNLQTQRIEIKDTLTINEQKEEKEEKESNMISPQHKKDTTLYYANCSTIKEQEQSCSSFISKQGFEELINCHHFETNPLTQNKVCYDRRIKIETDRMKKKFPQNFFK